MNVHPTTLAAYLLAGVAVVCITVLAALGASVPDVLGYALVGSLTGGAALSLPAARVPTVPAAVPAPPAGP